MLEKDVFMQSLGKHLRLKRYTKKLTLEQLAEAAKLDDKFLGYVERGKKLPSSLTLYKLSQSLDMSVDRLFDEVTEELEMLKRNDANE